MIFIGKRWLN